MKLGETPTKEQVSKARERMKLTQEQAAALIYKKWRAWDRYEKGERTMDPAYWELWQIKAKINQLEEKSSA